MPDADWQSRGCSASWLRRQDETRRRHRHGHGDAARLRRRAHMAAADRRRERRARSRRSKSPISPARSPARFRAATAPTAPTIPTSGWSRRSSARSTSSSSMRCARRRRRSTMPAGSRRRYEEQITTGVMIGSGIGGIEGIAETAITLQGARAAPGVAVLHSRPHHQSRLRLRVDRARAQGSEPRRRHRLLDRRACDRRCRPA